MPTPKQEATQALRVIRATAHQEGCSPPTQAAIRNAQAIISLINQTDPDHRYDLYPMEDGEIAIDAGSQEHRLAIFCYPDGHILCLGWAHGTPKRLRVDNPDEIQPDFIENTLTNPTQNPHQT